MAFSTINYFSKSLRKASTFNIIFPDDPEIPKPWSVFCLLHGLSDNHTTWMRRTSVDRYVEGYPLVVVMPDGARGWYTNALHPAGANYEDDLMKDVLGLVDRTFPVKTGREGRAIGGLSMGGYGAVKLGLKYPDQFSSVTSHSGALAITKSTPERIEEFKHEFQLIFGDTPEGGAEDCFGLAGRVNRRRSPSFRIDCGDEDILIEDNRKFHEHLDTLQIAHEFVEAPGEHNWDYWDGQIREAVAFHVRNLGIRKI